MQRLIYGALVVCGKKAILSVGHRSQWMEWLKKGGAKGLDEVPGLLWQQKLLSLCQTLEPPAEISGWSLRRKTCQLWRGSGLG